MVCMCVCVKITGKPEVPVFCTLVLIKLQLLYSFIVVSGIQHSDLTLIYLKIWSLWQV